MTCKVNVCKNKNEKDTMVKGAIGGAKVRHARRPSHQGKLSEQAKKAAKEAAAKGAAKGKGRQVAREAAAKGATKGKGLKPKAGTKGSPSETHPGRQNFTTKEGSKVFHRGGHDEKEGRKPYTDTKDSKNKSKRGVDKKKGKRRRSRPVRSERGSPAQTRGRSRSTRAQTPAQARSRSRTVERNPPGQRARTRGGVGGAYGGGVGHSPYN